VAGLTLSATLVMRGAESSLRLAIERLGADTVRPGYRGLYFTAQPAALYRIAYGALTLTRVLAPLIRFQCHSPEYLYKRTQSIHWPGIFSAKQTFAVFASVANSTIRHSQYAALTVKDAIVDQFRAATGARPDVEPLEPDVWVNLYLHANRATVSLDVSGGSMHRRGYRVQSVEAPMQETVAATMLAMSGWDGSTPLVDPMCGSGRFCEALCALPGPRVPAGAGASVLPDFDRE
jgi:putative N6-adenine-specific DNA methylase